MMDAWFRVDPKAAELGEKMGRKEDASLPPVHREFLPQYVDTYRHHQWALYHRADLMEISHAFWGGFLEHIRAQYNLSGGLMGVAVPLFEEQVNIWIKQLTYIGVDCDSETLTRDLILYYEIHTREVRQINGVIEHELVHFRTKIEWLRELYGREITEQELEDERKLWADLDSDIEAGKPASESEAAKCLKPLFDRYPRIRGRKPKEWVN